MKMLIILNEPAYGRMAAAPRTVMAATICAVGTPKRRSLVAFSCPDFATGLDAVRRVVQDGHRPAAIRLYDAVEARERLGLDPARGEAALLVVIVEGPAGLVAATNHDLRETAANLGLTDLGPRLAEEWLATRFSTAGLVRTITEPAGVADALEVANDWARLPETYRAMEAAAGAGALVYGHASHVYHTGANLYILDGSPLSRG